MKHYILREKHIGHLVFADSKSMNNFVVNHKESVCYGDDEFLEAIHDGDIDLEKDYIGVESASNNQRFPDVETKEKYVKVFFRHGKIQGVETEKDVTVMIFDYDLMEYSIEELKELDRDGNNEPVKIKTYTKQ